MVIYLHVNIAFVFVSHQFLTPVVLFMFVFLLFY